MDNKDRAFMVHHRIVDPIVEAAITDHVAGRDSQVMTGDKLEERLRLHHERATLHGIETFTQPFGFYSKHRGKWMKMKTDVVIWALLIGILLYLGVSVTRGLHRKAQRDRIVLDTNCRLYAEREADLKSGAGSFEETGAPDWGVAYDAAYDVCRRNNQ